MSIGNAGRVLLVLAAMGLVALVGAPAMAGGHTWQVGELFSNADGTIQFVELKETSGANFENGVNNYFLTSTTKSYDFTTGLVGGTAFHTFLVGTPAFCALFNQLPGNPTCDFTVAPGQVPFMSTSADTVTYTSLGQHITYTAGQLPTDGVNSLNTNLTTGPNSPKNFAGGTGSVDASPGPPGVPDGVVGSAMTVTKNDAAGSSLSIIFDTASCSPHPDHQIVYGDKSQFPAALGTPFAVTGSACAVGGSSPYAWASVPDAGDGSGLLWWVVVVKKNLSEGSWGDDSLGERIGPGTGGSSGQCGVTSRSLSNACGH